MHRRSSFFRSLKRALLFGAGAFLSPAVLRAQLSPYVPLTDAVYVDIDQLIGSGLVRVSIYGQRPYTLREVRRIVESANSALPSRKVSSSAQRVLQRVTRRFVTDTVPVSQPRSRLLHARVTSVDGSLEVLALSSPPRALTSEPVGSVAADINPLLDGRGGRRYAQNLNAAGEVGTTFQWTSRLGAEVRERALLGGNSSQHIRELSFQSANVSASALNITLSFGRQSMVWQQSMEDGLMLSPSSKPLDMLRASTEGLWHLPWILRYAGALRGTVFVADLGQNQTFPHSHIIAYKMNSVVNRFVELGAAYLVNEGGKGSPSATFRDRVFDLFPVGGRTSLLQGQFSNKIAGIETRFHIPALHYAQLYTEHYLDDIDRHFDRSLRDDGGHIVGASVAQIGPAGALSVASEYQHTGIRYYRHTVFSSGIAYDRTLLGSQLGSQGDAAYLQLRVNTGGNQTLSFDGAIERRGGDVWDTHTDDDMGANFRFVLVEPRPAEWRHRVTAQWTLQLPQKQQLAVVAGVERVCDANFVAGAHRVNALGNVQYSWRVW